MTATAAKSKIDSVDARVLGIIDCNPGVTAGEVAAIMRKPISFGFAVLMAIDRLMHDDEVYTGLARVCSATGYKDNTYYARREDKA